MIRHLKVLGISMVFTTVAMGFAYALPSALRDTAARPPETIELVDEEVGLIEAPEPPEVEDSSQDKPGDKVAKGKDGDGSGGDAAVTKDENHGAVVRISAHCPVKGRAHGELVRSVARDKDMTVSDAESACEAAVAEQDEQAKGNNPDKPVPPNKPAHPVHPAQSAEAPGQVKHEQPVTSGSSGKPDNPGKPANPGKPH